MELKNVEARADELRLLGLRVTQDDRLIDAHDWEPPRRRPMYSVSKSFTAFAVGRAVQEGLLNLDERIADLFADSLPPEPDEHLLALNLRHCLTMSIGQEKAFLMSAQRTELQEDDWVKAALRIPFAYAPGTHFVYSNVGPYLAGLAVQKRAGCDLVSYLMPRLFEPLGIRLPVWEVDPQGRTFGSGGLILALTELHLFGLLYLHEGCANGRQLISADWIHESSRVQMDNGDEGYGYLMWRGKHNSYRADGMYGQYTIIFPDKNAVVSMTAESRNQHRMLDTVLEELYPQL